MTPLETVKAAIAETPDPENREATLREALASTRYPVDGPASDEERDGWQSMARADRILTEAARRAIEAIPKIARLTRDLVEARAERDAARAVLKSVEWAAVGYVGYYVPCPACPSCRRKTGYANCYYSEPMGHAPDCALAAALAPSTPPGTPIAAGQAGEPMHHNQVATDLVRNAALEEAARVADAQVEQNRAMLTEDRPIAVMAMLAGREIAKAIRSLATRDTASAPAEPAADRDGGGGT